MATAAVASALSAQAPVLGSVEAPYPALQNSQPIHLAGSTYNSGQVAYGPVGTPLVISGSSLGDEGEVWFVSYKNGTVDQNAGSVHAVVTLWTPTSLILSVPSGAESGLVMVVTNGKTSNGLPFLVMPGAYSGSCPAAPAQNQLQIQTASLQDGAVSQSYSATLHAIGGSNSYTWSLASGSLPAGLSLSSSGTISGTPSAASGPVSITVQVADTSTPQQHDAATLSIEIVAQTEATSSAALYSFSIANASAGSGYDSVGNVLNYADSVNGSWSFNYDSLNRLASASGSQDDNPYPNYCWQYDSFGNRLWQTSSAMVYSSTAGGPNPCTASAGPSSWALYNGTVNGTANNQMSSTSQNINQGQYYDHAGNITYDGVTSYLYDGEGRICAVQQQITGVGTLMTQYLYDASGNRVAKGYITTWSCNTASNGFTPQTAYVLGPGGEQLTEVTNISTTQTPSWQWAHTNVMAPGLSATYDADGSGKTEGSLYFHLSDWLGTRRQQTDYAGNPLLNFTGLPYGDGLTTIPVSNTDAADATEHHFTGKERDSESGNDYFGARYYASSMGRWLSPDPKQPNIKFLFNPQKWNKYNYVLDNPLTNVDPDGQEEVTVQLRAYIPQAHQGPYRGDNRGPTTSQNVTSRTSITVRVETDPSKNGGNPVISNPGGQAGTTHNDWTGTSATQTNGLPTATVTRDSNGNVVINIKQDAANPLTPQSATPGIKSDLNVTIPENASSVSTGGTVSGSPAFELNVGTEGGANINIPLQGASNNPVAFGAGLTQTNPVVNTTPLPPPPPPPTSCATGGSCPH